MLACSFGCRNGPESPPHTSSLSSVAVSLLIVRETFYPTGWHHLKSITSAKTLLPNKVTVSDAVCEVGERVT